MSSITGSEDSGGTKAFLENLTGQVNHPDELDKVTQDLGLPAFLLNFYFATLQDLSALGLGKAVYIPLQIAKREGGRKSLFYLHPQEEVLAGIYIVDQQKIVLKYMKRVTGSTLPAQTGDTYSTRLTSRDGEDLFHGQGNLEVIDPAIGKGKFTFIGIPKAFEHEVALSHECIWWSLFSGEPIPFLPKD